MTTKVKRTRKKAEPAAEAAIPAPTIMILEEAPAPSGEVPHVAFVRVVTEFLDENKAVISRHISGEVDFDNFMQGE
jgi:hypothetical protein